MDGCLKTRGVLFYLDMNEWQAGEKIIQRTQKRPPDILKQFQQKAVCYPFCCAVVAPASQNDEACAR